MASRPEQLYEEDFYAWTRDQAQALRRLAVNRPNLALDFPHLIEEVADLGTSQRDAARDHLRRIIEHCLKLEHSPAQAPRAGWHETIVGASLICCATVLRPEERPCGGTEWTSNQLLLLDPGRDALDAF